MLSDNGLAEKGEVYMREGITGAVLCGGVRIGCAMRARSVLNGEWSSPGQRQDPKTVTADHHAGTAGTPAEHGLRA
jgi:hypothetical protein